MGFRASGFQVKEKGLRVGVGKPKSQKLRRSGVA